MEDIRDQELKHVCRLCNKRYPSGKSLGGHMRSHVIAHSYVAVQKVKSSSIPQKAPSFDGERDSSRVENDAAAVGGHSGYGLRENPKKTWRVVDSSFAAKQDRICKQCGKGFQSLKALCGHMSSHSEKERNHIRDDDDDGDDDGSWSGGEEEEEEDDEEEEEGEEDREFAVESHSANVVDAEMITRTKRSREVRYKNLAVDSSSLANGSSSNSEIEQEQEEVAMCLMMLSRDSSGQRGVGSAGGGGGVNFTAESSDNNSVILEGGSSSTHVGIAKRNLNSESNGTQAVKMKQAGNKKLKCVEIDNSDSGYFENGAKELESDGSVDEFVKNYRFKKPKADYGSRFEPYNAGFGRGMQNRNSGGRYPSGNAFTAEEDYEVVRAQSRHDLRDRFRNGFDSSEVVHDYSSKEMKLDLVSPETQKNALKDCKYECSICNKGFKTHQALGGHIITHKKSNGSTGLRHKHGEASIETSSFPESNKKVMSGNAEKRTGTKKTKGHKCPFCPKVFRSGQALGGHKRSHLIGSSSSQQDRGIPGPAVEEKPPRENHCLLDLNLPAPLEEEASGHAQYMPW
ncbi:hypothetical protein Ancab_020810 [Ancistrocladus abbreviatus]